MADRKRRAKNQAAGLLTWIPSRTRQSSLIDSGRRAVTRIMIGSLPGVGAVRPAVPEPEAAEVGQRTSAW